MLTAVIFDLDGVVTNSSVYHFRAWKKIADRLGLQFDEQYNEKLKGVSRMESLNLILDLGKGRDAYSEAEKAALADEKNEIYKVLIREITPRDLLPGIGEILETLRAENIAVALASVSKNAPFIIERLQVGPYFDYIADAAAVTQSKPAPDIFLDCLHHLGVRSEDAVGVEDARVGIEAIHRAGMKAVGVGTASEMQEADLILPGTAALRLDAMKRLTLSA